MLKIQGTKAKKINKWSNRKTDNHRRDRKMLNASDETFVHRKYN